jgi:hypothetical protein
LRGDRTASAKIAATALACIIGDALPQQAEHDQIAVLLVNARAAKFDEFGTDGSNGVKSNSRSL